VVRGLGIGDARDEELDLIAENPELATTLLAAMVSRRARIGWSTHGHSAVDVNIYSSGGPGTERIRGNRENTEVGDFLREYLDVDVDAITKELKAKMNITRPAAAAMDGDVLQSEEDHWTRKLELDNRLARDW
jgi:alkaline phosphatase